MTNWQEIHSDFTEELQKEWTNNNFSYQEVKELITFGLRPTDANFAQWLV